MSTMDYWEDLRKRRRERGLCVVCGRTKDHPKHLAHLKRQRERERLRRLRDRQRNRSATFRKKFLLDYKLDHACIRCGESHVACLEFHHRNPAEKKFDMFSGAAMTASFKAFNTEFQKCDLVCANCHRKIHYCTRKTMYFKSKSQRPGNSVDSEGERINGETTEQAQAER